MTDEDKQKPLIERINITMNYTDRKLARFIRSIQNEPWFQNTYLIVLADHGFPLGENGVSTMNGGGFLMPLDSVLSLGARNSNWARHRHHSSN